MGPIVCFLAAPVYHRNERAGNFYLAGKTGEEFAREDEETLVLFASQAALVIANARKYRDEPAGPGRPGDPDPHFPGGGGGLRRADGCDEIRKPGGEEDRRYILRKADQSPEDLLRILTFRRGDGREVSLQEFPVTQALSPGETVRAEEIVMQVPGN